MAQGGGGEVPAPCPSQQPQFDFQPTTRFRRPRPWERAPTSPFATHPRGRKVWKRYELPKQKDSAQRVSQNENTRSEEKGEVATMDSARPVKRLRVRVQIQLPKGSLPDPNPTDRYITTLQDKAPGTPKRKQAKRKSLRPDRFKKKKNDRRSSSSQKAATTSTEIGQAIGTVTDDQLTRTRTEASRAMGTLISTATRTESGQPSDAVQDGQSTIDSTMTDQATDKVIADQIIAILTEAGQSTDTVRDENTTAETSQTIDATKDEVLTNGVLEAQSKTSGVKSASTSTNLAATDNDAPDELSRTANTSLVDVERGEDQTEVPHESAPDETSDTNCLESETSSNDAETKAISETTPEQIEGPGRSTRPTPRFSDDTNMLKDFLNRVQAKKAAQKDQSDTVHAHMTDSRLSPRAALADVTLSPPQPSDFPNPRETPAGKQKPRAADCDEKEEAEEEEEEVEEEGDPDELAVQMRSCRRSPRTRLFTPAKLAAITRIPVRRADGTEPIVLRRSEAQELATVTRTNTRKNKGQAKPPKLTLKRLPAENADEMMVTAAKEDEARAVGWDKTLVYYMDQSEAQEGEEKRPRVRRLRKLGAVNGTPAPKKLLAEMYSSNEGSAPKRRSKSKGRVGK